MLKFKSDEAREAYNMIIADGSPVKLDTYCEKHHIIPKSLGGTDDEWNLIYLTAGEHLYAHYWLFVGTGKQSMAEAYFNMADQSRHKYDEIPEITDAMVEAYESAKIRHSENMRGNTYAAGRKWTAESLKNLSDKNSGEKNPFYGKSHSEEA